MQSVDGISQYQNTVNSQGQNVSPVPAAAGPEVSAVQQLPSGSVFQGTVTKMQGGQAVIQLDDGQTITARMEGGIRLRPGEPILFEVKSNNGTQISIRPVEAEGSQNPTLLKALSAAGLTASERSLAMVNAMMQNQMSIDKTSLTRMARLIQNFGQVDVGTLVQMKKLGLPVDQESIVQFERYRSGQHTLMEQFGKIMEALPEMPGNSGVNSRQLLAFHQQLLAVFQDQQNHQETKLPDFYVQEKVTAVTPAQAITDNMAGTEDGMKMEIGVKDGGQQSGQQAGAGQGTEGRQAVSGLEAELLPEQQPSLNKTAGNGEMEAAAGKLKQQAVLTDRAFTEEGILSIKDALNPKQQTALEQQLRQFPGMEEHPLIFKDGKLNPNTTPQEMLQAIQDTLMHEGGFGEASLKKLFFGKEYKTLLKQVMEQQWLLKPEEVAGEKSVEKLYERMSRQMERLETLLQNSGRESAALSKNASNVRSNLEFMNQVNQLYNYVQIPLKMLNQNAHSDLYVYTNKKKLRDKDGGLSALLHLDLEHLGTTDVQIKMLGNSVTTNFYLADERAYSLVNRHIGQLQEILESKGYQCQIHLEQHPKKVDFVEDFLEQEKPAGKLKRYSFDVLA